MPTAVTPHGLRTREALLDAGRTLAEERGLAGISVNAIVAEAGVAKGTFYVHFADRGEFVAALRTSFHQRVRAALATSVRDLEPGAARLIAGLEGYLDASLADRALKSMLREARSEALVGPLDFEGEGFAALIEPNLRAMGRRDAAVVARLIVAATAEVALIELERGRRQPAARRALRRLIEA